ncbi:hypothetical protein E1288_34975 [Saccharopolyspora elongata]|uniref:Nickel/cobalt efflux system n=1 Tax=Saccharopolyspora elongata TaxID=2530387 RepID=A0A4R4Y8A3_9PSEU|nr:hypothetical protein E1288_34975 [Saccharopolyspora elongata]
MGLLAVAALLGFASQATAHPLGTPAVAKVEARGAVVELSWSAAADDLVALGRKTGVLPPSDVSTDDAAQAQRLSGSTTVVAYLSSHIGVNQNGVPCREDAVDTSSIAQQGAQLRYACPETVGAVEITITALTDIDPAYRTMSVTEKGNGGLHTATAPSRTLVLAGSSDAAPTDRTEQSIWTTDLTQLLDSGVFLPLALLIAAFVGAFHAFAPGHGKTLAAGFLVGGRGRIRDALVLAAIVALMHTVSVTALGIGWWIAAEHVPDIAAVTRWLQLIGALLVVGVGVALLRRHLSTRHHGHGHGHGHGLPTESLLTWRGIVLLGASGGLLPSPSAFLVLLSGLLAGRAGAAMLMVAAFGIGMAAALATVSLAVLRGRDALLTRASTSPHLRTWSRRLPLAAATMVTISGAAAAVVAAGGILAP